MATEYHDLCAKRIRSQLARGRRRKDGTWSEPCYLPHCEVDEIVDDAVCRLVELFQRSKISDKQHRLNGAAWQACRIAVAEYFRQKLGRDNRPTVTADSEALETIEILGMAVEVSAPPKPTLAEMVDSLPNEKLQIVAYGVATGCPYKQIAKAAGYKEESGVSNALTSVKMRRSLQAYKPKSCLQRALQSAADTLLRGDVDT